MRNLQEEEVRLDCRQNSSRSIRTCGSICFKVSSFSQRRIEHFMKLWGCFRDTNPRWHRCEFPFAREVAVLHLGLIFPHLESHFYPCADSTDCGEDVVDMKKHGWHIFPDGIEHILSLNRFLNVWRCMSGKYIFELVSTIASPSLPPSLEFSSSITCCIDSIIFKIIIMPVVMMMMIDKMVTSVLSRLCAAWTPLGACFTLNIRHIHCVDNHIGI